MTNGGERVDEKTEFVPIKFKVPGKEGIHKVGLRKTKATIFVRPQYDPKTDKFYYDKKAVDWDKIYKLRDNVDAMFPGLSFSKKNVKQHHHASCDYNPYDRMIKYHEKKEEEKKKLQEKLEKKKQDKIKQKKKDKKQKLKEQR